MNKAALAELKQDIIDEIAETIPLNTTCPECQREINPECIIDAKAKCYATEWNKMAVEVIKTVIYAIPELLKEEIE